MSCCTVVDHGVDWITATVEPGETELSLVRWAETWSAERRELGDLSHTWGAHGYKGEKTGPIGYGRRSDGCMIVISGPDADARLGKLLELACHFTRIDLQVTVRYEPRKTGLGTSGYVHVSKERREGRGRCGARLVVGTDDGSTLYLGSRSSDVFLRLYDKGVESGREVPGVLWRYEVEYKGDAAGSVAAGVGAVPGFHDAIPATVHHEYQLRRVLPDFLPNGFSLYREPIPVQSDVDRSLKWLATSIAPTLNTLRRAGYETQVLEALGLQSPPTGAGRQITSEYFGSHGPVD